MPYDPNGGRYAPGGNQPPRRPGVGQPGVSFTPEPGMTMSRRGVGQNMGGVDALKRQLAKLMSDLAMAQAEGKSPRHIAEIQGKIYALQLEIQIAQENESKTADWLGDMANLIQTHSSRPYDNTGG